MTTSSDKIDQPQEIKDSLLHFIKNPKGFLLLSGKNGTGKTFLAKKLVEMNNNNRGPLFQARLISQANLNIEWHKQIMDHGDTSYLAQIYSEYFILALDDIGTRTPSEGFMDFLYTIIDARYENRDNCGTILTTNLNAKDMREKFGDAFFSRVSSGKCIRFDGEDRRFMEKYK